MSESTDYLCRDCQTHFDEEGEVIEGGCHACSKDCLCLGCAYDCEDCGNFFCRQHVIETPTELKRFSTYRCVRCDEMRQQKGEAA